ncbi:MAG: SprT-like domain-containing protein [Nitrososphaerales archaeon]
MKVSSRDPYNPFLISYSKRSRLLEAKFREFNEAYFNGRLSKYKVLLCSKPKSFGHEVAGYCLTKEEKILIRDGLGEKSTLQTLVHEMAHASLSGIKQIHGRQFARELARLRKLGAPLSSLDIDKQGNPKPRSRRLLIRQSVKKLIVEALIVEGLPKESVPKFLERELSLPISVIDQAIKVKPAIEEILARGKILNSPRHGQAS